MTTCGWCGLGLEDSDHLPCAVAADELRRYASELEARCDRRDLEVAELREAIGEARSLIGAALKCLEGVG